MSGQSYSNGRYVISYLIRLWLKVVDWCWTFKHDFWSFPSKQRDQSQLPYLLSWSITLLVIELGLFHSIFALYMMRLNKLTCGQNLFPVRSIYAPIDAIYGFLEELQDKTLKINWQTSIWFCDIIHIDSGGDTIGPFSRTRPLRISSRRCGSLFMEIISNVPGQLPSALLG